METNQQPRFTVFMLWKNGNPQLLHEVAWVRMILAVRIQNRVCTEREAGIHPLLEFCLRILP